MDDEMIREAEEFLDEVKKGLKKAGRYIIPIETGKKLKASFKDFEAFHDKVYIPFEELRGYVHYAYVDLLHVRNEANDLSSKLCYADGVYQLPRFESKKSLEDAIELLGLSIIKDNWFTGEKTEIRDELRTLYDAYFKEGPVVRKRRIDTKKIADKVNSNVARLEQIKQEYNRVYEDLEKKLDSYQGKFYSSGALFALNAIASAALLVGGLKSLGKASKAGPKIGK